MVEPSVARTAASMRVAGGQTATSQPSPAGPERSTPSSARLALRPFIFQFPAMSCLVMDLLGLWGKLRVTPSRADCKAEAAGGSAAFEVAPVGLGQGCHAGEAEVGLRRLGQREGCAGAFFGMAAMDPGGREADLLCRDVVVKEALRRVQDVRFGDAALFELGQHVGEIPLGRLVRADVLGGVDRVELDLQAPVAVRETQIVDVRQDDQLVVALEVLEGLRRIRKSRPVAD